MFHSCSQKCRVSYAFCVLLAFALPTTATENQSAIVWSLGTADGSSIEFAPGSRDELVFTVGESVLSRDFAGHQEGTIGWDPAAPESEYPYSIVFDLMHPPQGAYHLTLNLIYKTGAAKQIKIEINGKKCIYPVSLVSKKDVDAKDGNAILLAKQQLIVSIEATWLKPKGNQITIVPLGFGTIDYDSLSLKQGESPVEPEQLQPRLVPTMFFRQREGQLTEVCQLQIPFAKRFKQGSATIQLAGKTYELPLDAESYDAGVLSPALDIAALESSIDAKIEVTLDGKTTRSSHPFKPAKRWKVFLCPKIHNDVGFTDIQPHVNELDTRNTDAILSILKKYPFYKFNFETSWLVENYLDCRPEKYGQEVLATRSRRESSDQRILSQSFDRCLHWRGALSLVVLYSCIAFEARYRF